MKAAIYRGPQRIELQDTEIPSAEDGYVVAKPKSCGICGSDLYAYNGKEGWMPIHAPGHELSAVITEVGKGVENFKVGDRVTTEVMSHCGKCNFCITGAYNLCENMNYITNYGNGGFADYCVMHHSSIFKLPDEMTFEEGGLVEPFAVSYRAVRRTGARPGSKVVILGSGTIGLFCLAAAKAEGIDDVFITAKYDHQEKIAERMGASYVIRADQKDTRSEIASLTNGKGVDVVLESVGARGSFNDAIAITRSGGTVCLIGGYYRSGEMLNVEQDQLSRIVIYEINIIGSNCYGYSGIRKDFDSVIDLISSKKVNTSSIITHRFPLSKIDEAYKIASDKSTGSIKVHIQP